MCQNTAIIVTTNNQKIIGVARAVDKEYQNQGIGKNLIMIQKELKNKCKLLTNADSNSLLKIDISLIL